MKFKEQLKKLNACNSAMELEITEKTLLGIVAQHRFEVGDCYPEYRTMLLSSAEKDAKIKELEGMLNEAMRLLRIVDEEADLTHPMFLLSNWNKEYEALKKLRG